MKKKHGVVALVLLVLIVCLVVWGRDRIHFDFRLLREQVALANWWMIGMGVACIYTAYFFRSMRWATLMRHNQHVGPFSLIGTQVIGFTAVALIGRVADPVRPYLVSKRTGTSLSEQFAVYIVERLFDFGAMALIFSIAMIWVPSAQILSVTGKSGVVATLAKIHPDMAILFARFSGLLFTVLGGLILTAIRFSGGAIATFVEGAIGMISRKLGHTVANKVRAFHTGLDTIRSFRDFAYTLSLSLVMWMLITVAYTLTCWAFVASPALSQAGLPKCVLLMLASGTASIVQLPVIGWFSQIGIVAVALAAILGSSPEASLACAALLLGVTFLSIIPVGLIWAQIDNISLRSVAAESGNAAEVDLKPNKE